MKNGKTPRVKKSAAPRKKSGVSTPAAKKPLVVDFQVIWQMLLAPQDRDGLMEFKESPKGISGNDRRPIAVVYHQEEDRPHAVVLHDLMRKAGLDLFGHPMFAGGKGIQRFCVHNLVLIAKAADALRTVGMELTVDSPRECAHIASTEFADEKNLLAITRTFFSDDSVKVELAFGTIPVGMICPGEPSLSRGIRDLRKMVVKPVKVSPRGKGRPYDPIRAWGNTHRPRQPAGEWLGTGGLGTCEM